MSLFSKRKPSKALDDFEAMLSDNLDGMYRVALSLTRNPAQAQDLVHDTAVRALRFRDRFELGTNFKAWVFTILHHTFIHVYRRRKRERELLEGASRHDVARQLRSDDSVMAHHDPENAYLDHMLSDDVVRALAELPEEFRTVVTLCDLEGLSYKDIADVIGRPVGTVMSRLYRGRRLLEKSLSGLAVERGIVKAAQPEATQVGPAADQAQGDDGRVVEINRYRRRRA
jgi:RNA polymerase sigma-70 factor (ECF subfamily)